MEENDRGHLETSFSFYLTSHSFVPIFHVYSNLSHVLGPSVRPAKRNNLEKAGFLYRAKQGRMHAALGARSGGVCYSLLNFLFFFKRMTHFILSFTCLPQKMAGKAASAMSRADARIGIAGGGGPSLSKCWFALQGETISFYSTASAGDSRSVRASVYVMFC